MQIDRILLRQATRLAPKLLAQASKRFPRAAAPAPDAPQVEPDAPRASPRTALRAEPELRGSGSWANEWAGAKAAVDRARKLALPGRARKADGDDAPTIAEGTIRPRPLLTPREVKLHNWIADRLESAAPTCSLHAGVALNAFLASEVPGALDGLVADMVIVGDLGQVCGVLIRDRKTDSARQLRLLDALLDSELPVIDLPDRISLSKLWSEIEGLLPQD